MYATIASSHDRDDLRATQTGRTYKIHAADCRNVQGGYTTVDPAVIRRGTAAKCCKPTI